jgi:DNA ligase-associated metallophosphoesterase
MDLAAYSLEPGVILDARRALWLESERALVIADLHLGYSWAHRKRGQMLPLGADDLLPRLSSLLATYHPERVLLLGDIVHEAVPVEPFIEELSGLLRLLEKSAETTLIAGNHDRKLSQILEGLHPGIMLRRSFQMGATLFAHGDVPVRNEAGGRVVIGHEHPAICLGDGISSSARFPCFVSGKTLLVLPAFSRWAAGSSIGSGRFLSALTQTARLNLAVAIMGNKLLPLRLKREEEGSYRPCFSPGSRISASPLPLES